MISAGSTDPVSGFEALGVGKRNLEVLAEINFTQPTPIQAAAIPLVNAGMDVIGIAQTGTGKTLAFGLPMLDRLLTKTPGKAPEFAQGLILAPTRELALQIAETLYKVGRPQGVRLATLIGGAPMNKQVNSLRARPDIIVATPGRLEDHLHQRTMNLNAVRVVVLDEADRMLDMGFEPSIRRIMGALSENRQTLLFSATLPPEIESLAKGYLKSPQKVEIAPDAMTTDLVSQELAVVNHEAKHSFLRDLLAKHVGSGLIFARTRHGARKLAKAVRDMGHSAAEIHADRTLAQRRAALEGFKHGEFRFLIATDIAARGIDVKEIGIVVNYDLPDQAEDYVHRIGRTGRAGHSGRSVTIATPDQFKELRAIERTIRKEIPLSEISPLNPNWPKYAPPGERTERFQDRSGDKPGARGRSTPFVKPHHRHGPKTGPQGDSKPNFKPGPRTVRPENVDLGPMPDARPHDRSYARPETGPRKPFRPEPRNEFGGPSQERPSHNFSGRPNNDRARNDRPQADRAQSERPSGNRPFGDRPYSERPYSDRPHNDRFNQDRPSNNRYGGDRPQYDRPQNDRPYGDRPNGDRPYGDRPGPRGPASNRPAGDRPNQNRYGNDRPVNNRFGGDRPQEGRFGSNNGPANRAPYSRPQQSEGRPFRPEEGNDRPYRDSANGNPYPRPYDGPANPNRPKPRPAGPRTGFQPGPQDGPYKGPKKSFGGPSSGGSVPPRRFGPPKGDSAPQQGNGYSPKPSFKGPKPPSKKRF